MYTQIRKVFFLLFVPAIFGCKIKNQTLPETSLEEKNNDTQILASYNNEKASNEVSDTRKYDSAGHLVYEKNSYGSETWYEYDKSGNIIHKKTCSEYSNEEIWYEYDSSGNIIHEKHKGGDEIWCDYDSYGNLIHEKHANGDERWCVYDANGELSYEKGDYGDRIPTEQEYYDLFHGVVERESSISGYWYINEIIHIKYMNENTAFKISTTYDDKNRRIGCSYFPVDYSGFFPGAEETYWSYYDNGNVKTVSGDRIGAYSMPYHAEYNKDGKVIAATNHILSMGDDSMEVEYKNGKTFRILYFSYLLEEVFIYELRYDKQGKVTGATEYEGRYPSYTSIIDNDFEGVLFQDGKFTKWPPLTCTGTTEHNYVYDKEGYRLEKIKKADGSYEYINARLQLCDENGDILFNHGPSLAESMKDYFLRSYCFRE